jgi:hypothetical protein
VPAPDFALAALKGLSHIFPHAHVLHLKNEDFSRDPLAVAVMNADPLIAHETQPTKTVAEMVRADECNSAWGPSADRRGKSLNLLKLPGSKFGADSQSRFTKHRQRAPRAATAPPIALALSRRSYAGNWVTV